MALAVQYAATADNQTAEWILTQKHREIGKQTIFLARNAIRIVNHDSGYEVVARAPGWSVMVHRPDSKLAYKCTISAFHSFSPYGPLPSEGTSTAYCEVGKEFVSDLKTNKFKKTNGALAWMANDINADPRVADVLQSYYRSPITGIPIKLASKPDQTTGASYPEITTLKVQKLSTVSAKDFEYPTGLHFVKTMSEVLSSKAKSNELNSIMEDLGVGTRLGGK